MSVFHRNKIQVLFGIPFLSNQIEFNRFFKGISNHFLSSFLLDNLSLKYIIASSSKSSKLLHSQLRPDQSMFLFKIDFIISG